MRSGSSPKISQCRCSTSGQGKSSFILKKLPLQGEIPEKSNGKDFFELPVFSYHDGYLSTNISTNYFFSSQRHAEVPRLTQVHAALSHRPRVHALFFLLAPATRAPFCIQHSTSIHVLRSAFRPRPPSMCCPPSCMSRQAAQPLTGPESPLLKFH